MLILPLAKIPYFGNPSVLMDVYTLNGQLKDEAAQLPVPGTYKTWRKTEAPAWAATANLRPLDDPALDVALARLDKKRHKSERLQPQSRSHTPPAPI